MLIIMLVTTNFNGLKEKGKEYEVGSDVAKRWISKGLAAPALSPEVLEDDSDVNHKYEEMLPKELYLLCKERGIELDLKLQKQKAYLIEMLTKESEPDSTEE